MTTVGLQKKYFKWMCKVIGVTPATSNYEQLLTYLHHTPFAYVMDRDANRAEDGIELRYRFGLIHHISDPEIANALDLQDCSVLEMMVALSLRIEEHIMQDSECGNRSGMWFWSMISNLGLHSMDDLDFCESYTYMILQKFMMREYGASGEGALFTVTKPTFDARNTEIWYQMCQYLVEHYAPQ